MLLVFVPREDGDGLDEAGSLLLPVLLEKALSVYPVGHADHGERAIREMRQHERRYLREVTEQIAFGQRGLLQRGIGRPIDAIEVREADLMRPDDKRQRRLVAFQLVQYFLRRLRRSGYFFLSCPMAHFLRV